jgi:hypothetical protein
MSQTDVIEKNFKAGVLKELHRRNLITREELEKALKAVKA